MARELPEGARSFTLSARNGNTSLSHKSQLRLQTYAALANRGRCEDQHTMSSGIIQNVHACGQEELRVSLGRFLILMLLPLPLPPLSKPGRR